MKKIFVIALMGFSMLSAEAQFVQGRHYQQVSSTASAEPSVVEFFSFFCGHCFQFESLLDEFKEALPKGTKFEKSSVDYIPRDNEPVSTGMVKAFLTMKALKQDKKLAPAIFNHIHKDQKPIENEAQIKAIFLENGVSESDFDKHYNSDETDSDAKRMIRRWKQIGVSNVPSMLVNGKYLVAVANVGSLEELTDLINFLLKKK